MAFIEFNVINSNKQNTEKRLINTDFISEACPLEEDICLMYVGKISYKVLANYAEIRLLLCTLYNKPTDFKQ